MLEGTLWIIIANGQLITSKPNYNRDDMKRQLKGSVCDTVYHVLMMQVSTCDHTCLEPYKECQLTF